MHHHDQPLQRNRRNNKDASSEESSFKAATKSVARQITVQLGSLPMPPASIEGHVQPWTFWEALLSYTTRFHSYSNRVLSIATVSDFRFVHKPRPLTPWGIQNWCTGSGACAVWQLMSCSLKSQSCFCFRISSVYIFLPKGHREIHNIRHGEWRLVCQKFTGSYHVRFVYRDILPADGAAHSVETNVVIQVLNSQSPMGRVALLETFITRKMPLN